MILNNAYRCQYAFIDYFSEVGKPGLSRRAHNPQIGDCICIDKHSRMFKSTPRYLFMISKMSLLFMFRIRFDNAINVIPKISIP